MYSRIFVISGLTDRSIIFFFFQSWKEKLWTNKILWMVFQCGNINMTNLHIYTFFLIGLLGSNYILFNEKNTSIIKKTKYPPLDYQITLLNGHYVLIIFQTRDTSAAEYAYWLGLHLYHLGSNNVISEFVESFRHLLNVLIWTYSLFYTNFRPRA